MKNKSLAAAAVILGLGLLLGFDSFADMRAFSSTDQKETVVTKHASGTFEVKLNPQVDDKVGDPTVGRMSIDKQFHGDLEATSKGQMLAAGTDVKGSAGYVAMERVSGTLGGHTGTFALQHSGTMTRGVQQLSVTVVPDSGTGQLIGLAGKMTINIVDGKHFYEFEYALAESPKLIIMEEVKLIGIAVRTTNKQEMNPATGKIPALWGRFFQDQIADKIPTKTPLDSTLAAYTKYESDHTGAYDLIVGREVSSLSSIPDGMTGVTIPAGRYLLFTAKGSMPGALIDSWTYIWNYFSKTSTYQRSFTTDYEVHRANDKVDIYIAIK